jgi:hypothetical protein
MINRSRTMKLRRHTAQRGVRALLHPRTGGVLIEIMVAMSMFGLLLVGVAKLNFDLARRTYPVTAGAARNAIMEQQVNQFFAMPFDSVAAYNGKTQTVQAGYAMTNVLASMGYTRTVGVTKVSGNQLNVTIVITPANSAFNPDTIKFERTRPQGNPFSS